MGEKCGENLAKSFAEIHPSLIFILRFPEKWPQEISQKESLTNSTSHETLFKIFSPRVSGSLGAHNRRDRKSVYIFSTNFLAPTQTSKLRPRKRVYAGKKRVYTTTVGTLLFLFVFGSEALWCIPFFSGPVVYTLLFRTYGVYPSFPCFPKEMVCTIAFLAL